MTEFKQITLDNGLDVIAEVNPNAYAASFGFFVRTGSRDESDEISGVSHFLEHMVFKGTPRRSAADVNRQLDEMGGVSNAFTGEEATVFYISVLPELQPRAVDLLADIMRPSLREDDFNVEKNVILEEIKMYEDQPPFGIDEKCRELFFPGHPLSRSVLGTRESVGALTPEQMRGYFESRYAPGNIVAAASGAVDFEKFVEDVKRSCSAWEPRPTSRKTFRPTGRTGKEVFVRPSATQEYIFTLSDAPSGRDDERYTAGILANIVGDEVGSRLFWELVDNGKADCASLGFYDFLDGGFFCGSLCCAPESAAENTRIAEEVCRRATDEGVTAEELERAKNKILSRLVMASERSRGRLFSIGNEWMTNRAYLPIKAEIEIVRGMTLDEVNALVKKYPVAPKMTVAVGPLEELG
ncbi:MAG: insulinase family protein [Thermoguttaceae bacterium]|nr:insulinase family protein [Thermoguttaceae bacterium]